MQKIYSIQCRKSFLMILIIAVTFQFVTKNANAQPGAATYINTVPVTYGTNAFPFNTTANIKIQWIYAPGTFSTLGGGTGTPAPAGMAISKIYIRFSTANAATVYPNFTISLGQNLGTQSNWGTVSSTSYPFTTGLTTCFFQASGFQFTGNIAGAWYGITLQTPFPYDPSLSLIVEAKSTLTTAGGNGISTQPAVAGQMQRLYGANAATVGTSNTLLTPLGFDLVPTNVCTAPPTPGTATATPSIGLCAGNNIALNLSGNSTGSGQTYQWQFSTVGSGLGFSNIGTPQSSSLLNTPATVSGFYRCLVTCSGNTQTSTETAVTLNAGLSGTFTINSAVATGGTNFQTFAAAVAALSCGISGPVIFNVDALSGPYNEQIDIPAIGGASAVNTITFNGNGRTITFDATASTYYGTVNLSGADYLVFNDLNIAATGVANAWGIHFMNGSDNNTFNNCTSTVSITSTSTATQAVVMNASNTVYSTGGSGGNNNSFNNCTFTGGYYGVVLYGASGAGNTGNSFIGCNFRESYVYSTYHLYTTGGTWRSCIMERPTRTTVSTGAGIYFTTGCANNLIEKNRVRNMFGGATTSTGTCYGFACIVAATANNENKYYNNVIYSNNLNGVLYGLYLSGASYVKVYHNTISCDQTTATGTTTTYGIYATGTAGVDIRNNIVSIKRGGSGVKQCLYFSSASGVISNKNDLYINALGGTNYVGFYSTGFSTLAAWQGANSNAWDQQSQSVNPGYSNPAIGIFTPSSGVINDIGDNVGVTTDITGAVRSVTPDPGAYEFIPPTLDGAIAWVAPVAPVLGGPNTVTVSVFNNQATPITSLDLEYTDGITPVSQNFSGLNITTGNTQQLSFTTPYNIIGDVSLRAYITTVNGVSDGDQNNDTTLTQTLCLPLVAGTYTINSAVATGGTNFQSFSAAVAKMISCGIAGPIIFNVVAASGPYNEQIDIPSISGSSVVNTVTFNGNNNTITFNATSSAYYATVNLSGADYFIFNDLNIVATGAANAWGIHFMNLSDNNIFNNCTATVSITSTSTATQAVVMNASNTVYSTAGSGGNNNTFTNCTFTGGYYGVVLYGATGGLGNSGNNFIGCSFRESYAYSTYNLYTTNGIIRSCIMERPTRISTTTAAGGYFSTGCSNMLVEKNRVRNMFGATSTTAGTIYGFYCAIAATQGNENKFYNNVISDINFEGTIYGLYFGSASYLKAYHNTVVIDHNGSTTASATYGIYCSGSASVDIRNNIVYLKRGGSGTKTCLYYPTVPTLSNNNDLYVDISSGVNYTGYNGVSSYYPLSAWQSATGFDTQSKEIDPVFISPGTGDFTPTIPAMNAYGANVGIATDINGASRVLAFPDPGAFEFSVAGLDAAISWVAPVNPSLAGPNTVIVSVGNLRSTTITSLALEYTDGVTPVSQSFSGLNLLPSTTQQFTFTVPFTLVSSATLRAYISSVNSVSDDDQTNDTTATQNLCVALIGTYTINSAAPASATNFQSFTAAANSLSCGISGPVIFNVSNGPYNEQINIPAVGGASAINTITFNCSNQTLTYDATASSYYATLNLSGADYITFNDLNVAATGAANAWGIHFMNGSDNNNFNNVTSTVSITSTSTATQAVVMNASNTSYSTGGSGGNNNTFTNCIFTGGYYGVVLYGLSGSGNSGNAFIGCSFRESYAYSTYNLYTTNGIIRSCIMERPTRTSTTTASGGYFTTGCANMLVEKNRVRNMFGGTGTTAGTFYGFACPITATAGNENKFYNNVFYNINFNGTIYGLYLSGATFVKAYHNTLSLDHTASTTTATTYGIYSTGASSLDFRNNMITITRGGTGTNYGLYYTGTVTTSNYNDVVVSGTGTNYVGYNGTAYPTMLSWQGATVYDALSISTDPMYADASNGDFTPTVVAVNNKGIAVGITTDITGAPRNLSTPDIGAFEADFPPIDLGATVLFAPGTSGCYGNAEQVVITIKNYGFSDLDFGSNPATITCNVSGTTSATLTGTPSGILLVGASMNVTLSGTIDMSATGSYSFNAYSTIAGDGKATNDNMTASTRTKVPLSSGSVSASVTDYCVSGTPTLTLTGSAGGNIQWQSSTVSSSGPFTNVGTGTSIYVPASPLNQTTYIQAMLSCLGNNETSNVATIIINNPQPQNTTPATRCGPGSVTVEATPLGSDVITWYNTQTGGSSIANGNSYTANILSTTTFWAAAGSAGGGVATATMPAELTTFTGNVRGYWFTAPSSFTMTGLQALGSTVGAQSIAVVKFTGNVPPPTYSTVTNAFTTLYLTQNNAATGIIPVNIQITAGDVIGILGQRATVTSYGPATNPVSITIAGQSVALTRMGMQFTLGTTAPQDLWQEVSATTSIGRVEFTYTTGCIGSRVPVLATVTPAPALSIASTSNTICQGTSTTLSVGTGLADYTQFAWSPATGLNSTTGSSVIATPTVTTKYYLGAGGNVNSCQAVDSVIIVVNSVSLSLLVDNPLTCGNTSAQLSASVGVGNFTYIWTPATGLSSSTIANPTSTISTASQPYNVLVTDINTGCTKSSSVTIYNSVPQVLNSSCPPQCGIGPAPFSASGTPGIVKWYNQITGGNLIATGSPYTPTISATTTYYAAIKDVIVQTPVTTSYSGGTIATDPNAAGNMFNITAIHDISVTGFDIHLNNNVNLAASNISVYYRAGTYVGFQTNAGAWTLAGSASNIVSSGNNVPTPLPIVLDINIPAGQTYGFYICVTNLGVSNSLRYINAANSPAEGSVAASDYNLQVGTGTVIFGPFTGVLAAPTNRLWNGSVKYTIGCESARVPVVAVVTPPPVLSLSPTAIVCNYNVATLSVTSNLSDFDSYIWSPQTNLYQNFACTLPYTGQNQSTVYLKSDLPVDTTVYTCVANSSTSLCTNISTTKAVVKGVPNVVASAAQNTVCLGSIDSLTVTTGVINSGSSGNVGLTAVVTSSGGGASASGYGPELLNNDLIPVCDIGSVTFNWGWVTTNGWYLYTWATPQTFNKIVFYKSNRPFTTLNIETSTDGINFTPVLSGFAATSTCAGSIVYSSVDSATFVVPITTRYLRFNSIAGTNPNFREIQVFAPATSAPGLSYTWNPGGLSGKKVAVTPTVAGINNYVVAVYDSSTGCSTYDTIAIYAAAKPGPKLIEPDTSVCGNSPGFYIHVSDSSVYAGGYPPGTYFEWVNYTPATLGLDSLLVNSTDNYKVVITLPSSYYACSDTSNIMHADFTGAQAPVPLQDQDSVKCKGSSNGSAFVHLIVGGTPPINYKWYNSSNVLVRNFTTSDVDDTLKNVSAGQYTVIVTNNVGTTLLSCEEFSVVDVVEPDELTGGENITNHVDNLCHENMNGVIDIEVTGGTADYLYNWSNGATTQDVTGLPIGTYTVMISDYHGCSTQVTGVIIAPTQLTNSVSSTNLSCNGSSNGTGGTIASGGTSPYSYLWDNGSTTANVANLAIGNYCVVVTDNHGCTSSNCINVTQPNVLLQNALVTPVTCKNAKNGTITLAPSGGTPTYSYLWNNGSVASARTGLQPGTYTVTVTDTHGCTATGAYTIVQSAQQLALNVLKTNVKCGGKCTGTASISPTGGTSPYVYLWSTASTDAAITGLCAGTYTITVTDAYKCIKVLSFVVTENPPIVLTVVPSGPTQASAAVTGGISPYTYYWNSSPPQTTSTATGLTPGVPYKAKVTDVKGCSKIGTVTLPLPKLSSGSMTTDMNIKVYPNPTTGLVTLDFGDAANELSYTLRLFDLTGREVFNQASRKEKGIAIKSYDLGALSKGIYTLSIQTDLGYTMLKIILE